MATKSKIKPKRVKKHKQAIVWIRRTMSDADESLERARQEYRDDMSAVGDVLIEVKEALPHGEFESWVEENFDFTVRTARQYMRLARGETDSLMTGQQRG